MERELRVRFTGDANDLRRASGDAEKAIRQTEKAHRDGALSAAEFGKKLGELAAAYLSVKAAADAFMRGVAYNSQLETLKLGIASVVSANQTILDQNGKQIEGAQKLAIAQEQVAGVFKQLQRDAINTTATLPQLAEAFNAAVGSGLALGMSLDETREITVKMVQAMGALGVPMHGARQEINSILQGTIDNNSQLAKSLGITSAMVKDWQSQGTLVQNLNDKLKDFAAAGDEAGRTWEGATSSLKENIDTLLGAGTMGGMQSILDKILEINDELMAEEAQSNAAHFGAILKDGIDGALMGAEAVAKVLIKGAEGTVAILDTVRWMGANMGAESGGKAVLGSQLSNSFNPSQSAALMRSSGSLQTMLMTAKQLGMSDGDKTKITQIWGDYRKSVDKALEEQTVEIVNGHLKAVEETAKVGKSVTIKPNAPSSGGGDKGKALEGHQLLTSLHKTGSLSDAQYLSRLNTELGKVVKNSSDYFTILEKIKSVESKPKPYGSQLVFGPADGADYLKFQDVSQSRADDLGGRIEREATAYVKKREEERKETEKLADDLSKKSEASIRTGLEAGVTAFLDGGIGNLGEATYSLSKQAFGKALVDGVMSGQLKDAFGGLGAMIGPALANPIGLAVVGVLGFAIQDTIKKSQEWGDLRGRYTDKKPEKSQVEKDRESVSDRLGGLSTHLAEIERKLSQPQFLGGIEKTDLENERANILRQIADTDKLSSEINRVAAEEQRKAAAIQREAADAQKRINNQIAYSGLIDSAKYREELGGAAFGAGDVNHAVLDATGVDISKISEDDALKLADLYGRQQALANNPLNAPNMFKLGKVDLSTPKEKAAIEKEMRSILGVGTGVDLGAMLSEYILPGLSDMRRLGGDPAANIGSLSNPDSALQFDAPQTRNIVNNNQYIVQAQAFMGNKSEAKAFAVMIASEIRNVEGMAV